MEKQAVLSEKIALLVFSCYYIPLANSLALLASEIDENEACEYKYGGEGNDPSEGALPADAVDVEEEVGEPVVFGDEVAYVDKSDVEIGEENAVLYAACSDLTYGARSKEIEGVEDGREEVQTYAGPIGPIGSRGGVTQEQIVHCPDDEDGDESAKLPLHQWYGDGLAADEPYQLINHHAKAVEIAQVGEVEEKTGAVNP